MSEYRNYTISRTPAKSKAKVSADQKKSRETKLSIEKRREERDLQRLMETLD